jgi:hypothetical protein
MLQVVQLGVGLAAYESAEKIEQTHRARSVHQFLRSATIAASNAAASQQPHSLACCCAAMLSATCHGRRGRDGSNTSNVLTPSRQPTPTS